jgi:feruloyl-CoA synthase
VSAPDVRLPALAPPAARLAWRQDGSGILENPRPLAPLPANFAAVLAEHASARPNAVFLGAPLPDGGRATLTYGEAWRRVETLAAGLVAFGLGPRRPLMTIAENGIDHAVALLAAMAAGIPAAPIGASAAADGADSARLAHMLAVVAPGLILVDDGARYRAALDALAPGVPVAHVAAPVPGRSALPLAALETTPTDESRAASSRVGLDDTVKILFTSGSTGMPKAVPTTARMMFANIVGLRQLWPLLETPPLMVDWMPWHHCGGGSFNFNTALLTGGEYWIAPARPVAGGFDANAALLAAIRPTYHTDVPVGYERIADRAEADSAFRDAYFSRLALAFYAGSSMPAPLWERLVALSVAATGRRLVLTTGYGSTESAPLHTVCHWPVAGPRHVGVPVPGSAVKLVPAGEGRYEARLKGPNVTREYLGDAAATAALFDDEGWMRTGDAFSLADPADPAAGLVFHGRVGTNFKLLSGTWVRVDELRVAVLAAGAGLVRDALVAEHDRSFVGVLVFAEIEACRRAAGLGPEAPRAAIVNHPAVRAALAAGLAAHNARERGSSRRIARALVLDEPPERYAAEVSAKAYINQATALAARADAVERLYADPPDPAVIVVG